jgi:FkbM family methyltransferase
MFMNLIKRITKKVLQKNGWFLRKSRGLPAGVDLLLDLERLPTVPVQIIFDVGAHHGETAKSFLEAFPRAVIYSFEPVAANFACLTVNTARLPNVKCFQIALGDHEDYLDIALQEDSQTHSLRHYLEPVCDSPSRSEKVRVSALDSIMQQEGIETISLLKIDSEGFEVPVLKGAAKALSEGRINYVLLEASIDPADTIHSSLIEIQAHLSAKGYSLVAIYDQIIWPHPNRLAYFNALFVRDSLGA